MKIDRAGFRWVGSYYAYEVMWRLLLVVSAPLWLLGRFITGRNLISGRYHYHFTVASGRGYNSPPHPIKVLIKADSRGHAITQAAAIGHHYHMMLTAPF